MVRRRNSRGLHYTGIVNRKASMAAAGMSSGVLTPKNICLWAILVAVLCWERADGIRCYQCSSESVKEDTCGVYKRFDAESNFPVECQGEESVTPGTFCVKITQQSPRGFIWDGRWRQVIRRCASVSDTGVTGVCNWGIYENGVYWEECYCSEDGCNGSHRVVGSVMFGLLTATLSLLL